MVWFDVDVEPGKKLKCKWGKGGSIAAMSQSVYRVLRRCCLCLGHCNIGWHVIIFSNSISSPNSFVFCTSCQGFLNFESKFLHHVLCFVHQTTPCDSKMNNTRSMCICSYSYIACKNQFLISYQKYMHICISLQTILLGLGMSRIN